MTDSESKEPRETFALTGLVSRMGNSNWVFFFRDAELLMIDVGIMPALRAGVHAGLVKSVGAYGPQRGKEQSDDEAWSLELKKSAKAIVTKPYAAIARVRLHKRCLSHLVFVETDGEIQKFSLANRNEAEPVANRLQDRLGPKFTVTSTPIYAFFAKYAPFLNQ
jgi:hypothetical protein